MHQGRNEQRRIALKSFLIYRFPLFCSNLPYDPDYGLRTQASIDYQKALAVERLRSSSVSFIPTQGNSPSKTISYWSSPTHNWNACRMIWNDECPRNDHYIIVSTDCRFAHLTKLLLFHRGQPCETRVKNWQDAYGKVGIHDDTYHRPSISRKS